MIRETNPQLLTIPRANAVPAVSTTVAAINTATPRTTTMRLISATSYLKGPAKRSPAPTVFVTRFRRRRSVVVRLHEFADVDQLPFALK